MYRRLGYEMDRDSEVVDAFEYASIGRVPGHHLRQLVVASGRDLE
jgi:hypothetical protein